MTRQEAHQLLTKYLTNKNLIKHSLAAEASMKGLYKRLVTPKQQNTHDEEKWGITGLLHDIDYEEAQKAGKVDQHGTLVFIKEKNDIPADILHGIQAHAHDYSNVLPVSQMDWAITACDQLTGLIIACALVRPDKKLASVTPESVLKKFNQKAFAQGADREAIKLCESQLNIPLPEFIAVTLAAMQGISDDLEL
jgi:uncharacterized protein